MQRSRQSLYSEKVEFVKEQFSHILPNMIYKYNHFLLVESFKGESNRTNKTSVHAFQKFSQPNNHLNVLWKCNIRIWIWRSFRQDQLDLACHYRPIISMTERATNILDKYAKSLKSSLTSFTFIPYQNWPKLINLYPSCIKRYILWSHA